MAIIYIINNTEGTASFSLAPGSANGPGLPLSDTDLRLVGQGSTLWGEGVNENFLRLTESFACPEKAASPNVPQDESDLGVGFGINNPVIGQIWYNTTQESLLVWNGTAWVGANSINAGPTGGEPPTPVVGSLYYNTDFPQLMIYDGAVWTSIAERYVLKEGDTMTGDLRIDSSFPRVVINTVDATNARVDFEDAGALMGDIGYDASTTFVALQRRGGGGPVTESISIQSGVIVVDSPIQLPGPPTAPLHATTKDYVDTLTATTFDLGTGQTKLLFGSFPLPPGWNIDASGDGRTILIEGNSAQIGDTGGTWTIDSMLSGGTHSHGMGDADATVIRGVSKAIAPRVALDSHSHAITTTGSDHTHAFTSGWRPQYTKFAVGVIN